MSFKDHLIEDMSLVVLRSLSEMPQYRSNSSVLVVKLTERGCDVANGLVLTHGVKRPSAG